MNQAETDQRHQQRVEAGPAVEGEHRNAMVIVTHPETGAHPARAQIRNFSPGPGPRGRRHHHQSRPHVGHAAQVEGRAGWPAGVSRRVGSPARTTRVRRAQDERKTTQLPAWPPGWRSVRSRSRMVAAISHDTRPEERPGALPQDECGQEVRQAIVSKSWGRSRWNQPALMRVAGEANAHFAQLLPKRPAIGKEAILRAR